MSTSVLKKNRRRVWFIVTLYLLIDKIVSLWATALNLGSAIETGHREHRDEPREEGALLGVSMTDFHDLTPRMKRMKA